MHLYHAKHSRLCCNVYMYCTCTVSSYARILMSQFATLNLCSFISLCYCVTHAIFIPWLSSDSLHTRYTRVNVKWLFNAIVSVVYCQSHSSLHIDQAINICNSSLQFTIPTWCKWAECLVLSVTTKEMLLHRIKHSEQILETLCGISLTEYHPSLQQHRKSLGLHGLSLLHQSSSLN